MFQNLTPREKKLAMLVGGLLPLALIFWIGSSVSNYYFDLRNKKRQLLTQVQDQQHSIDQMMLAQKRRLYYVGLSAPVDAQSRNEYQNWLTGELERAQLKYDAVSPNKSSNTLTAGDGRKMVPVAEEFTYKVNARGTLPQIVAFLERFYSLEILHRIKSMEIKKIASREEERLLRLDLEVQLLRLVDAPSSREFLAAIEASNEQARQYVKSIVTRDFFGPANSPPRVATSSESFRVPLGRDWTDVRFKVDAKDDNPNDLLKFELLESNLPGVELIQHHPEAKSAEVVASDVRPGSYRLKVAVTDSGIPQKTTQKTITIDVEKERERETRQPPPKFQYATTTFLTGRSGDVLFVNNKADKNGLKHVKIGESFELDDATWTLISIDGRTVVLERKSKTGTERLTYRLGSTLDKPIEKSTSSTATSALEDKSESKQSDETSDRDSTDSRSDGDQKSDGGSLSN